MVLDIACGTGRVRLRLAESGNFVVGLDQSLHMLAIAQGKSSGNDRINWVERDMRFFALDKVFDLALIPSQSFQNMNTPDDQIACLENIWRHLKPDGLLVVHLDHMNGANMKWLGEISGDKDGIFEEGESFKHPKTGLLIKASAAWSYEPATQTAVLQSVWEEIGEDGNFTYKVSGSVLTSGTFSVQGSEITSETDSYCNQSGARKATYNWTFNNDILIFNILREETCPGRLAVLNLIQYHVEK